MRRLSILVALAVCGMFCTVPWYGSASSIYFTYYPSAVTGYYTNSLGAYGALPGILVRGDGETYAMLSTQSSTWWLETTNFTAEEWYSPYPSLEYVVGTLPPNDATIIAVYLVAYFMTTSPALYLRYSVDGGVSYNSTPLVSVGYGPVLYNITSMEPVWTASLINSTDFYVNATCTVVPSYVYYLDYLGIICMWLDDGEGGYDPGEDPEAPPIEEEEFDPGIFWEIGGIRMILGIVGFVGMIAVPALGVYVYRNGTEDRISVFVKMLAMFMICFTFLLVAFSD